MTVDAVHVQSLDPDRLSSSRGIGARMHVVGRREPIVLSFGGFAALGQPDGDKTMRDIYDVHFNVGLKPESRKRGVVQPFASVGVDFLYTNTRQIDGSAAAGVTMGLNARGGLLGFVGDKWMYEVSASYIGAIVAGTGEGLDGLTFHVSLGKRLFD